MRVFAEFVGGPLDGELAFLSHAIREFRVPGGPDAAGEDELIYRADRQLCRRAPTGERIWRFELVQT